MTPIELQNAFEIEMNRMDSSLVISTDRMFHYINRAVEEFVESRLDEGKLELTDSHNFELSTLVIRVEITPTADIATGAKPNSYTADMPDDYLHKLDEEVELTISAVDSRHSITECTSDTYRSHIDDVYSEHILKYGKANPLRLFENDQAILIGDGDYTVKTYYLRYIKHPQEVDLNAYIVSSSNGLLELPDHTHPDIVKIAVRMAIEGNFDPRYQTYLNESSKVE